MGRRYFTFDWRRGDHWEEHVAKVQQEGVNREGAEDTPTEAQVVYGQDGTRKARVRHQDAAIGLDSVDVHMGGDPVVVTGEIPDGRGGITQYVERYSDSGKLLGSYEVRWEKTGPGTHTLVGKRRIFY